MIQHPFAFTFVLLTIFSLMGCASKPATPTSRHSNKAVSSKPIYTGSIKARLNAHLRSWKGAPYKLGGLNKHGVDCSGFVYATYRDVFGRKIARTTKLQSGMGKTISKKNLKIGDLVFFKTGRRVRHVGVYTGRGKFIHASTSKGVMTSRLDSNYWTSHYWKSVRLN
jgi:cell wall-associated NlpC family hydrolase